MGTYHRNQRKQTAPPARLAHLSPHQAAIVAPAAHIMPPLTRQQLAGQLKVRQREAANIQATIAHLEAQLATSYAASCPC